MGTFHERLLWRFFSKRGVGVRRSGRLLAGIRSAYVAIGGEVSDDRFEETFDDPPWRGEDGFERPAR